jgi:hypothetical protein
VGGSCPACSLAHIWLCHMTVSMTHVSLEPTLRLIKCTTTAAVRLYIELSSTQLLLLVTNTERRVVSGRVVMQTFGPWWLVGVSQFLS